MAKTLQFKRYRTSTLVATTGAVGELIVDTNTSILTVHDGVTIGGTRLATQSSVANSNAAIASLNTYTISAYSKANAATTLAQAAFDTANTDVTNLSANVTILNGINTTQNTNISAVDAYATGAYGKANAVGGKMESAYSRANSAAITADAAYVFGLAANTAATQANVAIALSQAAFDSSNTLGSSITIIQGVNTTQNTNITAIDSYATGAYDKANAANILAQAAFSQANSEPVAFSAYDKANTVASDLSNFNSLYSGIESTQNTTITAIQTHAQAAFDSANTLAGGSSTDNVARVLSQASFDKANTVDTLLGDLVITGGTITTEGVSDIFLAPNGEGYAWLNLPSDASAANGAATVIGNGLNGGSGVRISSYNNTWYFNPDGSLRFPTLTVPISDNANPSGTGQTLKFSEPFQQAIIYGPPSDSEYNSAERIIIQGAPGYTETSGEGGDVYLWAGPGGSANGNGGDIKVRAGKAFGTGTGGYLNLQAGDSQTGSGGYINIESGETGTTGQGGYINIIARNGGDINLQAQNGGDVDISTYGGTWKFGVDGSTLLPQGGVVNETNIPTGGLTGKTIALTPYGGTNANQQLLIYPTAGQDDNHLHLTSGNLYDTELFLGDDNLYVKLTNTGNIALHSNDGLGNTAQWTFDSEGTITTTKDLTIKTLSDVPTSVSNWEGGGGWNQTQYLNLATTGGTGTGLTVDIVGEGSGYITINEITINNPGSGYTDGDVITIDNENNIPGTFTIGVGQITWSLANGAITFPDSSSQNTAFTGTAIDQTARDIANTKLSLSGGIIAGNVTANSVIANNSIYAPVYYSTGGASRLELTDINLVTITVAGQEYKFGASGIESSPGIFGGSFGGNKLLLNNETTLSSDRYDIVKIQTGTNGIISNEFSFSNNHLIFPDNTYQNTAFTDAQVTNISNANTKAQSAFDKANAAAEIITQNAQSTDYTLQRTDAGKHIYYTQASNTVLYIPTTSDVAFSNGTTVMIISQTPGANVTISPNVGVTMYLAGNTTSASRNVTSYGMATLIQVAANTWFINGTGVV